MRNVSDSERNQIIATEYNQAMGQVGFKRLDQSDVPGGSNEYDAANNNGNEIAIVRAIGGAITFGAGCVAVRGDAPASGDSLPDGSELRAPLSKVVLSAGIAYVFPQNQLS